VRGASIHGRVLALACVAALGACDGSVPARDGGGGASEDGPPNILVIATDDQRRTARLAETPATRRWFQTDGTSFARAYATTPSCCPSRASMFTGKYAHNHGVLTGEPGDAIGLDQRWTVQRYLRRAGYRTGIFGKYLNNWPLSEDPAHFDEWAVFTNSTEHGFYGGTWNVQGRVMTVDDYSTDYIERNALDFIRASKDDERPWLLFLEPGAPHRPFTVPPEYEDVSVSGWRANPAVREANRGDKPSWVIDQGKGGETRHRARRRQIRSLVPVDEMVGEVFELLDEMGEIDSTLAIYTSDNGFMWGEHGLKGKFAPYTASAQIPLFVRWPGRVEPGATDDRLATNVDMVPTILHAAGIRPRPRFGLDGRSLLRDWDRRRVLLEFFESYSKPTWASIRTRSYQFVQYYGPDGRSVTFREYYDLRRDPWQLRNLLGDDRPGNDPDVEALARRLESDRRCAGRACP
jgi:arylsulfatase A-like enzyme